MFLRNLYTERERKESEYLWRLLTAFKERRLSAVKPIYDEAKRQLGVELVVTEKHIHQTSELKDWEKIWNQFDVFKFLIRFGYDVHAADERGRTLLMLAINWDLEVYKTLLQSGADLDAIDRDFRTPLYHAIRRCKYTDELVRLLLEAGADPNRTCSKTSATPLIVCAQLGRVPFRYEYAEFLLYPGAHVNPADRSILRNDIDLSSRIVELLLQYGADVTIKDDDGFDAVHSAVYHQFVANTGFRKLPVPSMEVLECFMNLEGYPAEKRADAYHFIGCLLLIHCCCIIAHSFEEYDPKDYERQFLKVLFAKEYPLGYFHAYQKFVQGVQMWKKAEELRSDDCSVHSETDLDWEVLIQKPDQILLQIVRRFDTTFLPDLLEKCTYIMILNNDFNLERRHLFDDLLKEFNQFNDLAQSLAKLLNQDSVDRKLWEYQREVFENNLTPDALITISLTIPRKEVTRFSKPMQKLLRVEWDETDPSETYQFLTKDDRDLLPTDLELLKLGIGKFVRVHRRNYFTREFHSFFKEVQCQLFQYGLRSELMEKPFEETCENGKEIISSILQSIWDHYLSLLSEPVEAYSYMT